MSIKTPEYKSELLFTKDEMRTRIEKLREKNKALRSQLKDAEEVIRLVEEYRRLNEVGVGSQLEVANAYAAMARAQIAYHTKWGKP